MPFPVGCRCGQRFMAPDELAGQQLPCPTCGQPIVIPRPAPQPMAAAPAPAPIASNVVVTCRCGQSYQAPTSSAGQMLQCPACGSGIQIPFSQQAPAFDPFADPLATPSRGFRGGPAPNMAAGQSGVGLPRPAPGYPGPAAPGQPYPTGPYSGAPYPGAAYPGQPMPGPGMPAKPAAPAPANSNMPVWIALGAGSGILLLVLVGFVLMNMNGKPTTVANNPAPQSAPPSTLPPPTTATAPTTLPSPASSTAPASPMTATSTNVAGSTSNTSTYGPMPMPTTLPPISPGATPAPMTTSPMSFPSSTKSSTTPANDNPFGKSTSSAGKSDSSSDSGSPMGGEAASGLLESGLNKWHQATRPPFTGVRRVGDNELEQFHYSWMVELLPFLNHQDVYNKFRFDKPLTDSGNMRIATAVIPEFLMPGDDRQRWKGHPFPGLGLTHFAGMSGVEDPSDRNLVAAYLPRTDPRAGVFGYKEIATAAQITDGTSQTIMLVGSGKLANPWAMGGGATIRGAREPFFDKVTGLGTKGPKGGSMVVMADGSVRHVSSDVDNKVFRAMCTIRGADSFDLEQSAPKASFK